MRMGPIKTMLPNLGGMEEDGFCSKHDGWKAQGTYIHAQVVESSNFRGQQQAHIGNHPVMTHRLIMSSTSSSKNHATNFISNHFY